MNLHILSLSTKHKASDTDKTYFIAITTVIWIDVFTRLNLKITILDSLKYCQEYKGLEFDSFYEHPKMFHFMVV